MDFVHQPWKVNKIISLFTAGNLDLSPGYQRNMIWSSAAQKELLESVFRRRPMPSFFLRQASEDNYEVVDGQQRARTLIGFFLGQIETYEGHFYSDLPQIDAHVQNQFLNYELSITIITRLEPDERIDKFYALINSTGLRLNRPEIRKAEFYTTRLLRLVTTLAGLRDFQSLGLFTRLSAARMNDVDFASELIAQLEFGLTDKKDRVDELYEEDISEARYGELQREFLRILRIIRSTEEVIPLSKTRYRQKNDFYTLFGFLHRHTEVTTEIWRQFYRVLVAVGPYIRPSQDRCVPLKEYALNCVTQSNSKRAREERLQFFEMLLLNRTSAPNELQRALLDYFRLGESGLEGVFGFLTLNPNLIRDPDQPEMLFPEGSSV
jgi:hypothetical protein